MQGVAPSDQMLSAAIEHAVRQALAAGLRQDALVSEITAAVLNLQAESRSEVTAAERMERDSAMFLAKFDGYGGDRWAAGKVGAFFGHDPLDCERIAQRVRKQARNRKAGHQSRPRGRPPKNSELNSVAESDVCDKAA